MPCTVFHFLNGKSGTNLKTGDGSKPIFAALHNRRYGLLSMGTSAFATIMQGLALAITYWLLKRHWGADYLGAWSIIVSILMFGRIAEFGMGQSLVSLLPKALERGDSAGARDAFVTVAASTLLVFGLLAAPAYVVGGAVLSAALPAELNTDARHAFAIALAGFLVTNIGLTFASASIGLQKTHLSNSISAIGSLANLVVGSTLIPQYGLSALAWGYFAAGFVNFFLGLIITARSLELSFSFVRHFRPSLLNAVLRLGISMQFISISSALTDLFVKLAITRLGGLDATGIFELASRYVLFLRAIFAASQNYLGGVIARAHFGDGGGNSVLAGGLRTAASLTVFFVAMLIIGRNLVGAEWAGEHAAEFGSYAMLLAIGWAGNIVAAPAYFGFLGIGSLKHPAASQFIMLFLTVALSAAAFALNAPVLWIVGAFSISLLLSQIYLFSAGLRQWQISIRQIIGARIWAVALAGAIGAGFALAAEQIVRGHTTAPVLFAVALLIGSAYTAAHVAIEFKAINFPRKPDE